MSGLVLFMQIVLVLPLVSFIFIASPVNLSTAQSGEDNPDIVTIEAPHVFGRHVEANHGLGGSAPADLARAAVSVQILQFVSEERIRRPALSFLDAIRFIHIRAPPPAIVPLFNV